MILQLLHPYMFIPTSTVIREMRVVLLYMSTWLIPNFYIVLFLRFLQGWKIAKMAFLSPCQRYIIFSSDTKILLAKRNLLNIKKKTFTKNIAKMSLGPPIPGFRSVELENWHFLEKESQEFKSSFQFRFQWIPSMPEKQN